MWSLTASHLGNRRVERVPREWIEDVEKMVLRTQTYLDALKEVMAINVELLTQTRIQNRQRQKVRRRKNNSK